MAEPSHFDTSRKTLNKRSFVKLWVVHFCCKSRNLIREFFHATNAQVPKRSEMALHAGSARLECLYQENLVCLFVFHVLQKASIHRLTYDLCLIRPSLIISPRKRRAVQDKACRQILTQHISKSVRPIFCLINAKTY